MDHEILFCSNFGVSCINLSFYPLGKLVFENCSTDVGDPLLWSFGEFYVRFRQIGVDLGMVLVEKLPDLFDSKAIITKIRINTIKLCGVNSNNCGSCAIIFLYYLLWDMDGPNFIHRNPSFLSIHQFSQKVDRDIVVGWEEDSTVCGEEVVDLPLALILGCKLL